MNNKKPLGSGSLKIGAGSIRAYPHSASTGLVISDTAKIQTFCHSASLSAKKLFFRFASLLRTLYSDKVVKE
jgi:hypothetical protein